MAEAKRLPDARALQGILLLLPAAAALASCGSAMAQPQPEAPALPASTGDARADALLRALASGDDAAARAGIGRVSGSVATEDELIARVRECEVAAVTPAGAAGPIRAVWRCRVPHLRSAVFFNAALATTPRPADGVAILEFDEGRDPPASAGH